MTPAIAPMESAPGDRPRRVVVLGGGFAGVSTARYLTRMAAGRTDIRVELLSEENYFVFQPLLPEVAAGSINPNHVVNPIRELVPRARFRWCTINGVDWQRKVVTVTQGEGRALVEVPYDHLVFGLGKLSDLSSMPGVSNHALSMKTLSDAFRLRNHMLRCLELADIEDDPDERKALLTFVVAGAGFSGVETIGELSEMLRRCGPSFRNIDMGEVRLCLVHSHDSVLPEMSADLGQIAEKILRRRAVELIMNARLRAATRHGVHLSNGQFVPTKTLICTVGNVANPVIKSLLESGGFVEGKHHDRGVGVLATDATLLCIGRPDHWAVGDNAGVPNPERPDALCPPTAQFAVRQAKTCAHNILATIDGRPLSRFDYRNLGMLASLGRRSAVAQVLGTRFSGFPAWVAWRSFYLAKLPGTLRKVSVALDWALDLIFPRDIAQIHAAAPYRLRVDHYEPGDIIIRKDEVGRELFVVQRGTVEVFRPATADTDESVIAALKDREVFGEKALMEDTRRGASVRAATAADVLVISREDFAALAEEFPVLHDYFDRLMQERYQGERHV